VTLEAKREVWQMRRERRLVLVALALALVAPPAPGPHAADRNGPATVLNVVTRSEKQAILAYVKAVLREGAAPNSDREQKFVRVTNRPFHVVSPANSVACASGFPNNPHTGHWIHVFVTQGGYDAMRSGKGVYPKGTLILKQKFMDAAASKTDVFTGMLKREKGYNAEAGDWEFFVVNSNATTVRAAGRLESCIDCHAPFHSSDFVSRRYLTAKEITGK
jgi:hypothetical protein